ncbi:hypothetical protein [Nitratidesulfovibrio sp. SRB-5]|uniref:hypothetical protein n=1 Tax=Nitratidesulfovibrio sp. SRB-5 TaxID=2872636 RepID=UPI0010252EC2|nr:hypothetical protein [Nitratidesulfovibrio sp. SRB-5]MBZ2170901.1 hypothetical protein [Nitratidesulfovibrio sp. SRB-5]RXF77907.1 hypothetical protein EKK70_04405 [Desulfovibrio sp. DS-1]
MDEKRYCVHAALGTRGERLRLVRVRPERCQSAGQGEGEQPHGSAASIGTVGAPFTDVFPHDAAHPLPLPGARPVVLAEGLTARQAERLAALLSGLVDADVPQADGTIETPVDRGNGGMPCIAPTLSGGKGIAVPEGAQRKARDGLNLLREALLSVMACNPRGLTGPELLFALGLDERPEAPGMKDARPHGAALMVQALLELLREAGAVRGGEGR